MVGEQRFQRGTERLEMPCSFFPAIREIAVHVRVRVRVRFVLLTLGALTLMLPLAQTLTPRWPNPNLDSLLQNTPNGRDCSQASGPGGIGAGLESGKWAWRDRGRAGARQASGPGGIGAGLESGIAQQG